MFLHMYKYKLKSMFRQKEEFFWIMLFPLILGTFFFLAFAKISSSTEDFKTIDVAIVNEDADENVMFKMMIESLTSDEDEVPFFNAEFTDAKKAAELLSEKDVTAIITLKNGTPTVTINENGIYETMTKCVMDSYIQTCSIVGFASDKPEKIQEILSVMNNNATNIVDQKLTDGNTDNMADYYYALIAMACMFATMSGQICATHLNANLSAVGMRKGLTPRNKMAMILSDAAASFTIHMFSNAVLIVYLQYILKVNLGGNFLLIYLVSLVGSLIALSIGILVGSIHKLSDGAKMGINISISLVSSFMSGLMVGGIKQSVEKSLPILNRLNPSTLISDALYALNIYDDYRVFSQRLLIMIGMSIVLCIISFIITRREKYDSI